MKTLLWLDDSRDPLKNDWMNFSPIGKSDVRVIWVKSYNDFVDYIYKHQFPDGISFDFDLYSSSADGLACAVYLIKMHKQRGGNFPICSSHSSNEDGRKMIKEEIDKYLLDIKHYSCVISYDITAKKKITVAIPGKYIKDLVWKNRANGFTKEDLEEQILLNPEHLKCIASVNDVDASCISNLKVDKDSIDEIYGENFNCCDTHRKEEMFNFCPICGKAFY